MKPKAFHIYLILIALWLGYTAFLIVRGAAKQKVVLTESAARGKMLWQQNNCTACHQLYGLGGFLGPDLTNVFEKGGAGYIKAFVMAGTQVMPAFHLPENELDDLAAFLEAMNRTGSSDPADFTIQADGMIVP